MIFLYMPIIWEVETYPGAWASALMQPIYIYKGGGKDRHSPVSHRGIYLLNTVTKLFERLMKSNLSKFTKLNDTLTPSQQGSRITRQIHDAIYALIATIQERSQYGFPSYCCFIDFATAYPSVHREHLGLTLKNYKITGKIWHLLKENSRSVRVQVLHALIDQNDELDILRGLPEGRQLSPTLFGICVAELILELKAKFPLLQFPLIIRGNAVAYPMTPSTLRLTHGARSRPTIYLTSSVLCAVSFQESPLSCASCGFVAVTHHPAVGLRPGRTTSIQVVAPVGKQAVLSTPPSHASSLGLNSLPPLYQRRLYLMERTRRGPPCHRIF